MWSDRVYLMAKIPALSGESAAIPIPADCRSLVIYNALGTPIYGRWGSSKGATPSTPTATDWDFAGPGNALIVIPVVAEAESCRIVAIYPGAVPAADVQAVVYGSDQSWAPTVGPLA